MAGGYVFDLLDNSHDRAAFACGIAPLDAYFHRQAGQDMKRRVAAVFVLHEANSSTVIGYYTLSNYLVHAANLPPEVVKKLGRYPDLPATLLGRLAVDGKYKGQGFGGILLANAFHRCLKNEIPSCVIVVDALDEGVCGFYQKYGFSRFPDQALRLFITMATVEKQVMALGLSEPTS